MVLRCSLLGHDYGEPDVEREREERGSEVVVTVQEFEECARCGDRHVISENTEVTSLSMDGDDARPDAAADADSASASEPPESSSDADVQSQPGSQVDADADPETTEAAADADETAAEFIDAADAGGASEDAPAATAADDAAADDESDVPTDENGDPITDDGEILEDTVDEPTDRNRGEWPETDDVGPPVGADEEPSEWPDADDAGRRDAPAVDATADSDSDVDSDLDPAEDDAVVLEHDSSSVGGHGSEMVDPEELAAEMEAMEREDAAGGAGTDADGASEPDTGIERADVAPAPAEDGPMNDGPSEFYCPRCEFVASDERASLRAGDICPECRKGYLGERPRH